MKTTIVAVTNSYNDTVTMLPPSAHIDGIGHVTFHNNPRLEFDGENNVTNFGCHIDFRITKNKLHAELMGDMYHHYPRLKRRTQYLNVFKFNKERAVENQITIPHYYMATLREGEHVGITNFGIPKCDKVVIKEQLGARGSNQVVVPTNMLTTLLKHSKGKTLAEVKEAFPDLIYTDNSNWDMLFFDNPNDLFVSELITNVKSEYRLLVGGDVIYGRERTIKAGPYPQANLDVDKFHTVQEVNYERIDEMFDESLVETLYAFARYIDLPIGSIDLYSTTDGKWGIFEYSTQFAFHGANPNFIKQLLLDGIKQVMLRSQVTVDDKPQVPMVEVTANEPIPKPYVSNLLRNHEINHVHAGVNTPKESFRGINKVMKEDGLSRGNSTVVVGEVDRFKSQLLEADVPEEISTQLYALYSNHRAFIDAFNRFSTRPRIRSDDPNQYDITGIRINNSADNGWSYVLDAGQLTLSVAGESVVDVLLPMQGYEICDFITVNAAMLSGDGVLQLRSIATTICNIVKEITALHKLADVEKNEPIAKTKPRMVRHIQSVLMLTYAKVLSELAAAGTLEQDTQCNIRNRVVGYTFQPKSGFDWCYKINARDLTLTIHASKSDDDELEIYINDTVPLKQWLHVRASDLSRAAIDRITAYHGIMLDCVYKIDAVHVTNITPETRIIQTAVLNEVIQVELDNQLQLFVADYEQLVVVLDNFRIDLPDVKLPASIRLIENKNTWYLNIECDVLSMMAGVGSDGNPNFHLTSIEESLSEYAEGLGQLMKPETKVKMLAIYNLLVTRFKRIVTLKTT